MYILMGVCVCVCVSLSLSLSLALALSLLVAKLYRVHTSGSSGPRVCLGVAQRSVLGLLYGHMEEMRDERCVCHLDVMVMDG